MDGRLPLNCTWRMRGRKIWTSQGRCCATICGEDIWRIGTKITAFWHQKRVLAKFFVSKFIEWKNVFSKSINQSDNQSINQSIGRSNDWLLDCTWFVYSIKQSIKAPRSSTVIFRFVDSSQIYKRVPSGIWGAVPFLSLVSYSWIHLLQVSNLLDFLMHECGKKQICFSYMQP